MVVRWSCYWWYCFSSLNDTAASVARSPGKTTTPMTDGRPLSGVTSQCLALLRGGFVLSTEMRCLGGRVLLGSLNSASTFTGVHPTISVCLRWRGVESELKFCIFGSVTRRK